MLVDQSYGRSSDTAELPCGIEGFLLPWLTVSMLACFIGIFDLEQRFALTAPDAYLTPSHYTLIALAGASPALLQAGEAHRLLSAPLLHHDLGHLIGNGLAFALSGYALERFAGRAWMFCIFACGAFAGSLSSMLFLPSHTLTVSASGGIMAMLVALWLIAARLPAGRTKYFIQTCAVVTAIPALIPMDHGPAPFGSTMPRISVARWPEACWAFCCW